MPKNTPLRVTANDGGCKRRESQAPWLIVIGESKRDVSGHNTKDSALQVAKEKARQSNRPGIIVERKDGRYQKFVANDDYWKRGRW